MPLYIIVLEIIFKSCRRDYTPHNKDPQNLFRGLFLKKFILQIKEGNFAFNLQSNNMNLIKSQIGFRQVKIKSKKFAYLKYNC